MTRANKPLDDEYMMRKLKEIILREDREALAKIEDTLNDPKKLSEKVSPVIEEHLDFFKEKFPKEYQKAVNRQIEARLVTFQDEMIGIMYPVLGKMIRKYITHQFQLIKDKIDQSVRSTFSFETAKRKFRSTFFGISESDLVLKSIDGLIIEEVYVIQRNSGLLLGNASVTKTIDQDVIAGMLTAIKSFVEDAFQKESEDLEMIHYGSYKIFMQSFYAYYIAVAINGSLSAGESEQLSNSLFDFAEKELSNLGQINDETVKNISSKLNEYFIQS